jgi:hypothetical protein
MIELKRDPTMFDAFEIGNLKMKILKTTILILILMLLVGSCQLEPDSNSSNKEERVSISISTSRLTSNVNLYKPASALGTFADITSITVDVKEGDTFLITAQSLTESAGTYSGTLTNLPVGPGLTFVVHAYNASATEIFSGTIIQTLTGSADNVEVYLSPIDDGTGLSIPSITKIEYLRSIRPSKSGFIKVYLKGQVGETLTYLFTPASGGGTFFPASGTITGTNSIITLITTYSAPAIEDTFSHSFQLTNDQGNFVKVNLDTVVDNNAVNSDVDVSFYPVVSAFGGSRIGDDIYWNAVVSDDDPVSAITYAWSFDGGLSFENAAVNPAKMLNYTTSTSGNVSLSVTDNYGSGVTTQINYVLETDQFPDPAAVEVIGTPNYILPDTGQTQSFTGNPGEDSDYSGYAMSFTESGGNIVIDNMTTLVWEKTINTNSRTWSEADSYCTNLSLDGFSDWRLPSVLEMKDIVNYGTYSPAIDTTYFGNDIYSYWTSDTEVGSAWMLNFTRGTSILETDSNSHYTRCVRGSVVTNNTLVDNGNGTVSDNGLNLTWQADEGGYLSWESALNYCETLSLNGFNNWRLPNIKEMVTLVRFASNPPIDTGMFSNAVSGSYWSGTTRVDSGGFAWGLDFSNGKIGYVYKTGAANIRCVRSGL